MKGWCFIMNTLLIIIIVALVLVNLFQYRNRQKLKRFLSYIELDKKDLQKEIDSLKDGATNGTDLH